MALARVTRQCEASALYKHVPVDVPCESSCSSGGVGVLGVGCALPYFHPVFPRTVYHKTPPSLPILINTSQTGRCQILPTVTLTIQHPAEEGGMMSLWGMLGANQSLRKLCQPLLSLSIQCYRSAVNWDWRRGHFLCVWEKKEKKRKASKKGKHCGHANGVERR